MKSTTGTNNTRSNVKRISADEIKAIISAGKDANCEKIEYNGLIITYASKPQSVVVATQTIPDETPSTASVETQNNSHNNTQLQIAPDLDFLLIDDPVEYERQIQLEGTNASKDQ